MKFIKITLGIVILIGTFGSFVSLTQKVSSYEMPELLGHIIAILLMIFLSIYLFRSANNSSSNEIKRNE